MNKCVVNIKNKILYYKHMDRRMFKHSLYEFYGKISLHKDGR